jgi:hypothetical protein
MVESRERLHSREKTAKRARLLLDVETCRGLCCPNGNVNERLCAERAETGRIQITFVKAGGEGNGNLFFGGQKVGLSINGIKIGGFRITRIDLVGTASNLRSASDIIGTYTAADAKDATVAYARMAQLGNPKGVVLEVRGVNLNRRFTLNLSGMNIKNLGWQPLPE